MQQRVVEGPAKSILLAGGAWLWNLCSPMVPLPLDMITEILIAVLFATAAGLMVR
ncbi:MAG: hypothetical protein GXP62_06215 [Oligoflexia bacterium]|nr:hypothetical protein [Oligoflexia bacterium]